MKDRALSLSPTQSLRGRSQYRYVAAVLQIRTIAGYREAANWLLVVVPMQLQWRLLMMVAVAVAVLPPEGATRWEQSARL
jgi:hypothetical protein